jgi:UDP-2,3-diacylglucosamine pyrophosphatase LpxH
MVTRKGFIASLMSATATAAWPASNPSGVADGPVRSRASTARGGFRPLAVKPLRLAVGARVPFKALHVTDAHLTRVDATENDVRKMTLAATRGPQMGFGEHYLSEAVFRARNDNALLLLTGDIIDFVSNANLSLAKRYFASVDAFGAVGNHEFSQYVGEAKEDAAYRAVSAGRVAAVWPNDITFASRVVHGVNFVAVDNGYYRFTGDQFSRMEQEVAKGLPIVLLCHVPLHLPKHYAAMMRRTRGVCSYEAGVPDALVDTWRKERNFPASEAWRDRRVQQRADTATKEFVSYLKSQSLVKAILCGHTHAFWQERFSPTAVQYISAATYSGSAFAVDFV